MREPAIGSHVTITGVQAKPELNGTIGVIVSYSAANGRFGVRTSSGELVALRPAVLLPAEIRPPMAHPSNSVAQPASCGRIGQGGDIVTLWHVVEKAGVPILAEDGTELGRARCGEVIEAYAAAGDNARLDPSEAARLLTCGIRGKEDEDEDATMSRFLKQHAQRSKHWARGQHWDVKAFVRVAGIERFGGRSGGPSGPLWFVRSGLERALLMPPRSTRQASTPAAAHTAAEELDCLKLSGVAAAETAEAEMMAGNGGGDEAETVAAEPTEARSGEAGAPPPLHLLRAVLDGGSLSQLVEQGYLVVDGALTPALCRTLREEMDRLEASGQMWQSKTYAESDGAAHMHVQETSLDYMEARAHAPTFAAVEADETLLRAVSSHVPGLAGLDAQHVRLQINAGHGGCYSMHTDAGRDVGLADADGRPLVGDGQTLRLTALFYISRGWKAGDGGELRLYPYPHGRVSVAPLEGRLVLFEPRLVHDVAPNFRRRHCFTLWCSVRDAPSESAIDHAIVRRMEVLPALDEAAEIAEAWRRTRGLHVGFSSSLPRALRALFLPELRMILVRVTNADAEIAMIKQSHADDAELQATLDDIAFHHECVRASNPRWLLELLNALPALPPESPAAADALPQLLAGSATAGSGAGEVLRLPELRTRADMACPWWASDECEACVE